MSKTKSITDLINELQSENEQAKFLAKLFNQAVKHEFNFTVDELHEIILKFKAYEKKFRQQDAAKQGQHPTISRNEV